MSVFSMVSVSPLPVSGGPEEGDVLLPSPPFPDFTVFGAEFTVWWQKLLGLLWALGIFASIAFLIFSIVQLRRGTSNTAPGQADYAKAKANVMWSTIALGALVGLAVIVGVIIVG